MSAAFFMLGMIWVLGSVVSLILAPLVGFDRKRIKLEIYQYYATLPVVLYKKIPYLILLSIAMTGFFIPTLFPVYGFLLGCLFFALC
jgi:hypothetical protein